jgi:small-conductance mechanosensitive channel
MEKIIQIIFGIQTAFAQSTVDKDGNVSFNVLAYVIANLPLWITAVIVFVVSLVIGYFTKGIVENRLASKIPEEHQEVLIISGRVAFIIVAIIGTTIALAIAGIDITTLLAAIGFGISFGLQDTIANFVAGLGILASRPFTIGDWIKVNGSTGKVVEIRTRATYLKTFDGLRLIVPNKALYSGKVLSYTSNQLRRIKVPIYCRYLVDVKDVIEICLNVVRSNPQIYQEPKPNVVFIDFADYYMNLEVRFWVDSKGLWRRIQSDVFIQIQKRLEEAGLDSPYPVTSLSLEQDAEAVVLKHQAIDPDSFSKMMNARMAEEEAFAKRRQELVNWQKMTQTAEVADLSGASFLKATTSPAVTTQPVPPQPETQPQAPQAPAVTVPLATDQQKPQ